MNANVHVLLVSGQAAPNLLPTLDPELKPREAILLVTEKMKSRAAALETVLREAGIKTSRVELPDEHNFVHMENIIMEIAANREGDSIALNVTGGTKLMALAAQSIAATAGWEVFYVEMETDEVIPLKKDSPRRKLTQHLKLPHYLRAYGYTPECQKHINQTKESWIDLENTLIKQIGSLEKPIGLLNRLTQRAEDKKSLTVKLLPEERDSRGLEALLRNFEEAGLIDLEDDVVRFKSDDDRFFSKGGWLEDYVFRTIGLISRELGIRDKDSNLVLVDGSGVKNELDVVFMARNRLFVIECKTARMDGDRAQKANDALFKVAEISRRVGGLGARAMLASYRKLNDTEKRLAGALNVELVCGAELTRLDERLKRWVAPL